MVQGFFTDDEGLAAIKERLARELERELPPGLESRIGSILNAALSFTAPAESRYTGPLFDFRSLSGENLLPTGEGSFSAGDFLKLSQVFERSLVGLISASELPNDDKTRFITDMQAFFDGFDTALLNQLEDELVSRGLIKQAKPKEEDDISRYFNRLGFSRDLADEMTDPVLLTLGPEVIYANSPAVELFGREFLNGECWGPSGFLGDASSGPPSSTGEWIRRRMCLPASDLDCDETLVSWKSGNVDGNSVTIVLFPSAGKDIDSSSRMRVLKRESQRFKGLYRLSKELISGNSIATLARRVCRELSAVMHYDALLLHINHAEFTRAFFHLATGVPDKVPDMMLENSGTLLDGFGLAVRGDVQRQMLNKKSPKENTEDLPESGTIFVLPLVSRDDVFGTVGLYRARDIPMDEDDLHLFSAFTNQLTLALKDMIAVDSMRKLLRDNEEQMALARRVQIGLLPGSESFDKLKFHTRFLPAAGVSGDFYHFFSHGGSEGLVIGDASGHGISASLIMAAALTTFRDACSEPDSDPATMLRNANQAIKRALSEDFFVVACAFSVNTKSLKARYSSAGHLGPFLLRPGRGVRFLTTSGVPLGMFDDPQEYKTQNVQLQKGDRVLFFTDGVIENRNSDNELYGLKRLRKRLKQGIELKSDALLDKLVEDILAFQKDPSVSDDMTLVLLEVA